MSKKIKTVVIAVLMALSAVSIHSFASDSASAAVPVLLTISNEYKSMSVTVPASLPIEIINGVVLTADNAKITNNSKSGSVKVSSVAVNSGEYSVGSYEAFSGKKTIALKINDIPTKSAGKLGITATAFPTIAEGENIPLEYYAKVSNDTNGVSDVEAAKVVFTITVTE